MAFLASMILPFVVAGLLSAVCSLWWRGEIAKPWLFWFLGSLLLLGLHRLLQAGLEVGKIFFGRGYFLEGGKVTPATIELLTRELTLEALALAVILAVLGIPLLAMVRGALRT